MESTNVEKRKKLYRNRIMEIIRHNDQVSRVDIKKLSGFSMTTTLETVENMLRDGLLMESGTGESTGGRKPTWLKINPKGGYFLGIEFNAERIFTVILDLSNKVIFSDETEISPENQDADGVMATVFTCISGMIKSLYHPDRIMGIGVGVPGYVDGKRGTVSNYPFIRRWEDVDIRRMISDEFGIKVYIENNVNAMALSYKWMEYGGVCDNLVFLTMRTGLRLGSIVRGRLLRGNNNAAGEIDHFKLRKSNRLCSCGQKGCLVTEVSNGALLNKIREGIQYGRYTAITQRCGSRAPVIDDFIEAVKIGDNDSVSLMLETAKYIGEMLSCMVTFNNPNRIVISTVLSRCGSAFLESVEKIVSANCSAKHTESLVFSYSKYGIHAGAIGAASIVMQYEIGVNPHELI